MSLQIKEKTVNNNIVQKASENGTDWVKEECQKGISDLYQLNDLLISDCSNNEKGAEIALRCRKRALTESVQENPLEEHCLLEYLLSHQSMLGIAGKDSEKSLKSLSYDDLLQTFKELSKNDQINLLKRSTLSLDESVSPFSENQRSQLSVLPEESLVVSPVPGRSTGKRRMADNKECRSSYEELPRRGRRNVVLKPRPDSTPVMPGSQMDALCSLINNFLVVKADESGYESDSTRAGSDSPRGSIKSSISDIQLPRRVVSRNNSNTSFIAQPDIVSTENASSMKQPNTCCETVNETKCDDAKLISSKLSNVLENIDDVFYPPESLLNTSQGRDLSPANETDEEKLSFSRKRNAKINIGIRRGDVKSLGYKKPSTGSHLDESKYERITEKPDISLQSLLCKKCKPIESETKQSSQTSHLNLYQRFLSNKSQQGSVQTPISTAHVDDKEFKSMRFSKDHTGELGVYIQRRDPSSRSACYVISYIEPGGVMHR